MPALYLLKKQLFSRCRSAHGATGNNKPYAVVAKPTQAFEEREENVLDSVGG